MRQRELRHWYGGRSLWGATFLLAFSACGNAFRASPPKSGQQALAEGTKAASSAKATSQRKGEPSKPVTVGLGSAVSTVESAPSPAAADAQGALQPISATQMLDHAMLRYETALKRWEEGQSTQAREETDLAFRALMLVPSVLSDDDGTRRDEVQLKLSRLVVMMSAVTSDPIGGHSEIPLVMNQYIDREIRSFQTSERYFLVDSFRRSGRFLPNIIRKLEEAHMPTELAWLPLIESGFTTRALSPKRALGLWQFIPSTGYRFGLDRDVWVDERMDPELATDAALNYLKELHYMFGDWSTAIAAYNCGEMNVVRAIRRQKVDYLDSFWDLFPILPYETARYVPRFLATVHIIKDPARFGFTELGEPYAPWTYETVEVNRQTELKTLARLLNLETNALVELNPALRRNSTPPRPYQLRVPQGYGQILTGKLTTPEAQTILAADVPVLPPADTRSGMPSHYRVRQGDTLSSIARKFRVSVSSIVRANSLMSQHQLSIGQLLRIPRRGV